MWRAAAVLPYIRVFSSVPAPSLEPALTNRKLGGDGAVTDSLGCALHSPIMAGRAEVSIR